MDVINIAEKFAQFDEYWSPHIIGEVNDHYAKVAKLQGEFVWHHHDEEDELFLVIEGHLTIKLRDRVLRLGPGDLAIIPHGVDQLPIAEDEVHVLLLEPETTLNTGSTGGDRTVSDLERI